MRFQAVLLILIFIETVETVEILNEWPPSECFTILGIQEANLQKGMMYIVLFSPLGYTMIVNTGNIILRTPKTSLLALLYPVTFALKNPSITGIYQNKVPSWCVYTDTCLLCPPGFFLLFKQPWAVAGYPREYILVSVIDKWLISCGPPRFSFSCGGKSIKHAWSILCLMPSYQMLLSVQTPALVTQSHTSCFYPNN